MVACNNTAVDHKRYPAKSSRILIGALLSAGVVAALGALNMASDNGPKSASTPLSAEQIASGLHQTLAEAAMPHTALQPDGPVSSLVVMADNDAASPKFEYGEHMLDTRLSGKTQYVVADWLSKKYKIANKATAVFVSAAYSSSRELQIDPLLVLAVMAIESGFNPYAESPVGAQGLMQVMYKVHHEKFATIGGDKAVLNPAANIKVGAAILKDYVVQGGSVEEGLKRYVGAAAFASDNGYGYRVLAEYKRLKQVANKNNATVIKIASTNTTESLSADSSGKKSTGLDARRIIDVSDNVGARSSFTAKTAISHSEANNIL